MIKSEKYKPVKPKNKKVSKTENRYRNKKKMTAV